TKPNRWTTTPGSWLHTARMRKAMRDDPAARARPRRPRTLPRSPHGLARTERPARLRRRPRARAPAGRLWPRHLPVVRRRGTDPVVVARPALRVPHRHAAHQPQPAPATARQVLAGDRGSRVR